MLKRISLLFLIVSLASFSVVQGQMMGEGPVRVQGAVAVALPLVEAIKILKKEQQMEVELSSNGGSTGGIAAVGQGAADIGLTTRRVTAEERADHPTVAFSEIRVGAQAVALTVSRDVWDGGIHALSVDQARDIYEGTVKNWKALGGPDQKISVFMSTPGRGIWEMFAQWLYGEIRRAPEESYPTVETAEEVRNSVEFTPGSFSQVAPSFIDNRSLFALAINNGGRQVEPTVTNFRNRTYPLCRDLFFVVNDQPTLKVKVLVDFMLGEQGQALIKKVGLVPLADLADK